MQFVRHAEERGTTQLDWLDSKHSFSFADYYDAQYMGFGPLRVINEDFVEPGKGFPMHPHKDMEIITYILNGSLEHKDSLGNGSIIKPGEIQKMSAGTGILHSEFNPSSNEPVHLLQIWIQANKKGLPPKYEQQSFDVGVNQLKLLGTADGQALVTIHQDVELYAFRLEDEGSIVHKVRDDRLIWVQIASGSAQINGQLAAIGDGVALDHSTAITIKGTPSAQGLLFVMAAS
jgi:redox-sensitive bicupin YhaK (pirin superfamily)